MNIILKPKIAKESVEVPNKTGKKSGLPIENYYANGVLVLRNSWHMEDFGDKPRKAVDRVWDKAGLQKLLGLPADAINSWDFPNSYPNTLDGTVGKPASTDFVRVTIENFVLSNNAKLTNMGSIMYWGGFLMKFGINNFALRSKLTSARNAYQEDFYKAGAFVDLLLANFETLSKYMSYSEEEASGITKVLGTPQAIKIKSRIIGAWEKIPQNQR